MTKREFLRGLTVGAAALTARPAVALAERIRILPADSDVGPIPTGMVSPELQRLVTSVRVGEARAHGALLVFWLHAVTTAPPLAVATLDEARPRHGARGPGTGLGGGEQVRRPRRRALGDGELPGHLRQARGQGAPARGRTDPRSSRRPGGAGGGRVRGPEPGRPRSLRGRRPLRAPVAEAPARPRAGEIGRAHV